MSGQDWIWSPGEALEASGRLREAIENHAFPDEEIQPSMKARTVSSPPEPGSV